MALAPKDAAGTMAGVALPSFPNVGVGEMVEILRSLGLPWITADDLNKPTYQLAHKVYTYWLETLSGVDQEWLERRRQDILDGMDHRELYEESLTWILFYREVSVLMRASKVYDFGANDILRPQAKRFKKHMSALVNFYRFSDERLPEFQEFIDDMDRLVNQKTKLLEYRDTTTRDIENIKARRAAEVPEVARLDKATAALSQTMHDLEKEHAHLMEQVDIRKHKRSELASAQRDLAEEIGAMNDKVRRLQSRVVTSPQQLKDSLSTLAAELKERKLHLGETERRAKDFEARIAVVKGIDEDLTACQLLLAPLSSDQHRLDLLKKELLSLETDYDGASSAYEQVSQTLAADLRQLENAQKRLERMKKTLDDKRALRKKREEDWAREREDVEKQRRKRGEEASRKRSEAADIEREVEKELHAYDAKIATMISQRNDLVKLAGAYMEAISSRLDWRGEGLVVDIDAEDAAVAASEELELGS